VAHGKARESGSVWMIYMPANSCPVYHRSDACSSLL
jgi:hypothetical protein